MNTKLLLVISNIGDDPYKNTDAARKRNHLLAAAIHTAANKWLSAGACGVLVLNLPREFELRVYQVGPEVLTPPPEIVVRYAEQDEQLCHFCSMPVPWDTEPELFNGEPCHPGCVPNG